MQSPERSTRVNVKEAGGPDRELVGKMKLLEMKKAIFHEGKEEQR
jgi:hypothetical protein